MTTTKLSPLLMATLAGALPMTGAYAQQQPDAGQTLQQQQQAPQLPRSGPAIAIPLPSVTSTPPGGVSVTVSAASISGASVFTETELLGVLGDFAQKSYDLAGLRELAEKISSHYRDTGYPFARAYIPAQPVADGKLRIEVIEGRYGKVNALGDDVLSTAATGFLADLKPGTVISSDTLERATLVLDDQPGIQVAPIIRPGQELGTGDLDVRIERTPGMTGDLGYDNHGNRFTGEHRLRANLQWDSPFSFGDQVIARLLYSDEEMWLGSFSYSLPIGTSGLRGNVGYAHTAYALSKDFASLNSTGTAKVTTLGVSYPVIRSQRSNLSLATTLQHKILNDKQQSTAADDRKSSLSALLALNFDHRDGLWGGGITYGSLSYTPGRLKLDDSLRDATGKTLKDRDGDTGQNTRGSFDKWNLDVARAQATSVANLTLFGRLSAQWAGKNLDSSEGFSLGGVNGVRAYPSGEGNGDEGWLVQLEARYTIGSFSPYLFHDSGRVKLNANNDLTTPANPNNRSIGGEGVGLRYTRGDWNMDATLAWRSHGGRPLSDGAERNPRFWLTAGYKF
jgi:hemolysin activation/secretion protein